MAESKHTIGDLRQMQSLPLEGKLRMTIARIQGWIDEFGEDGVYVSFSGGKDSTVLLDIVRNEMGYKNIPAVFVDVPTQYPELRDFAKTWDNVEIIRPNISFMEVCETYGFPLVSKEIATDVYNSKHWLDNKELYKNKKPIPVNDGEYEPYSYVKLAGKLKNENGDKSMFNESKWEFLAHAPFYISGKCCSIMKKAPIFSYEERTGRKPIIGQMAEESRLRTAQWLKNGCNAFNSERPVSNPMSFWTEQDVLKYIKTRNIKICSVYGDIIEDNSSPKGQTTLFGNEESKLKCEKISRTGCMMCGFGCHLDKKGHERFLILKETHPKMYNLLDMCKNNGVTFREAIEWTNEHGNLDIKL